jgi:hypothetical protein
MSPEANTTYTQNRVRSMLTERDNDIPGFVASSLGECCEITNLIRQQWKYRVNHRQRANVLPKGYVGEILPWFPGGASAPRRGDQRRLHPGTPAREPAPTAINGASRDAVVLQHDLLTLAYQRIALLKVLPSKSCCVNERGRVSTRCVTGNPREALAAAAGPLPGGARLVRATPTRPPGA